MKVLLCGEGPGDQGRLEWCDKKQDYVDYDGWLQALVRKLDGSNGSVEFDRVLRKELFKTSAKPKGLKGHGVKARIALRKAMVEGYDVLIFMADADTPKVSEWRSKLADLLAGWADNHSEVKAVACFPMSASESWLLSDQKAWEKLGLKDTTKLPKHPENIWGERNDPGSDHPHQWFGRICLDVGLTDDRATRVLLMQQADMQQILIGCPKSFGQFLQEIKDRNLF